MKYTLKHLNLRLNLLIHSYHIGVYSQNILFSSSLQTPPTLSLSLISPLPLTTRSLARSTPLSILMLRLFLSPPPIPPPPLSTRQSHRRRLLPLLRCSPQLPSHGFADELGRLLVLLPQEMKRKLEAQPELENLVEVVMDLGRRPLARFPSGDIVLSDCPISSEDLHHAASQVGDFAADNRAGISRTLHRISAIRNRKGGIVGLTCRVGRAVPGSANMLRDLVKDGGSLLLIGPPGVGKTTVIRF